MDIADDVKQELLNTVGKPGLHLITQYVDEGETNLSEGIIGMHCTNGRELGFHFKLTMHCVHDSEAAGPSRLDDHVN